MAGPDVRYAQNAGINIAYQVFGEGPRDLILVCGTMSNLELFWLDPLATAMLERLGRFSRVILFDKPGTGLSDPIPAAPTVDQRVADIVAVLDAAGSEKAVVIGYSEGGLPGMMLAAAQPDRVQALILLESLVAIEWNPDLASPREHYERMWAVMDEACERWGQGGFVAALAPTWVDHPFYGPLLGPIEFTDIVDSTRQMAAAGDERWRRILSDHDRRMDELLVKFGGVAVKHTGDGRLAHFARPARAIRFATAMTDAARSCGLEIRVGIHTGECESVGNDLIGLAVNIGARIAALAGPGEVLVSSTVKDLVIGSGLTFKPRGEHELKGAPGRWAVHRCDEDRPGPLVAAGYDTDVRNPTLATPAS